MTDRGNGGGAATNAGVEFQQRVSAVFLMGLILDVKLNQFMEFMPTDGIESLTFESGDQVDDLVVRTHDDLSIYLQMKRSIVFSTINTSEFYKTIRQFVSQHADDPFKRSKYVLVTSNRASGTIKYTLNKILISYRSSGGFPEAEASKEEKESHSKFMAIIDEVNSDLTNPLSKEQVINFISHMHLLVIDIEQNSPFEQAILLVLSSKSSDANLLWQKLITSCMQFAVNRLTVNKENSVDLLKFASIEEKLTLSNYLIRDINSGKINFDTDYLLLEDSCSRKYYCVNNHNGNTQTISEDGTIVLNGSSYKIIARASTESRLKSILDEDWKDLAIFNIRSDISFIEARKSRAVEFAARLPTSLICQHCAIEINRFPCYIIETDYIPGNYSVGPIHRDCLRGGDRVIGALENQGSSPFDQLPDFELNKWLRAAMNGNGFLNSMDKLDNTQKIVTAMWQSRYDHNSNKKYCVTVTLSDGSRRVILTRGKVHKLGPKEAEVQLHRIKERICESLPENDRIGYSSINGLFGTRNLLQSMMNMDENFLPIVDVTIERYSSVKHDIFNVVEYYYAPLYTLSDEFTEEQLVFYNIPDPIIPILSNPLDFARYYTNWKNTNMGVGEFTAKMYLNDIEFDLMITRAIQDNRLPVINPTFLPNGELRSGIILVDHREIMRRQIDQKRGRLSIEEIEDIFD